MQTRKVVITGIGAVSPYGTGTEILIKNLYNANSAVKNMKSVWESKFNDLTSWVAAPVSAPPNEKEIERKFRRFMGPVALYSAVAAKEAIANSGLTQEILSSGRTGVSFSSGMGSVIWLEKMMSDFLGKNSIMEMPSGLYFKIMSHTCAANIAHLFTIKGRNISPDAACTSSSLAIGLGFETVQFGKQDIMICGGADELHPLVSASFNLVGAASTGFNDSPQNTPRPFDKDRDGTVCGEGAGALILESEESAARRGAKILAEVVGFHSISDGEHLAEPHTESIAFCLKNALDNSGLSSGDIDYINAHATGTILGDAAECKAIKEIFGENVPVSGFKGYMGHTLGASGALELIACVRMMNDGRIIPTHNLKNPGDDTGGIQHVQEICSQQITYMMKNSFAFGGINTVLILKRY